MSLWVAVLIVTLLYLFLCEDRPQEVTQLEHRGVGQPDQWCRPLILVVNTVQCRIVKRLQVWAQWKFPKAAMLSLAKLTFITPYIIRLCKHRAQGHSFDGTVIWIAGKTIVLMKGLLLLNQLWNILSGLHNEEILHWIPRNTWIQLVFNWCCQFSQGSIYG